MGEEDGALKEVAEGWAVARGTGQEERRKEDVRYRSEQKELAVPTDENRQKTHRCKANATRKNDNIHPRAPDRTPAHSPAVLHNHF